MTDPIKRQRIAAGHHHHRRNDDSPDWQQLLAGMLLGAAMIVFPVLLADYGHASPRAKQAVCQSNLNTIDKAIQLYRTDHKQYPPDLAALVTSGAVLAKGLACPSVGRPYPSGALSQPATSPAGQTESDYVYVPGLEFDASANTSVLQQIRAFELPADHNQAGASVLYRGQIKFITDLPQLLADLQLLNDFQAEQRRGNP